MSKILKLISLSITVLLLIPTVTYGQVTVTGDAYYELNINGYMGRNNDGCGDIDGLRNIYVEFEQGPRNHIYKGRKLYQNVDHKLTYTKNNKVRRVQIHKIDRRSNFFGCNKGPDDRSNFINVNSTAFNWYAFDAGHGLLTTTVNSRPVVAFNRPTTAQTLGDEEYLTITLPNNLENRHYNWMYRIGATGTPTRFPDRFNNKNELRIRGKDFLPDTALNESISVWVEMGENAGDKLAAGIAVRDFYLSKRAFCGRLGRLFCKRGQTCNRTPLNDRRTCLGQLTRDVQGVYNGWINYNALDRYALRNQNKSSVQYRQYVDSKHSYCNNLQRKRFCVFGRGSGSGCRSGRLETVSELNRRKIDCRNRISRFDNNPYSYGIYRNIIDGCNNLSRDRVCLVTRGSRCTRSRLETLSELNSRKIDCRNSADNLRDLNGREQTLISINKKLDETNPNGNSKYRSIRSHTINFTYKESAPTIKEVVVTPAKCFNSNDAQVKVIFNRDLRPNEQIDALGLNIGLTNITNASPIRALVAEPTGGWSYTYPRNIPNGIYTVNMIASINGKTTFTGGAGHRATASVQPPTPVIFDGALTKANILCNNANTGTISVKADGGTNNNYTVEYRREGSARWNTNTFSATKSHTINGLSSGKYEIRLKDGNGCLARDGGGIGIPTIERVTISQPDPLKVEYIASNTKEPTAFGFTNGQIEVKIYGGTIFEDGTYVAEWKDISGITLTTTGAKDRDGSGKPFYRVLLQNIPSGKYFLTVKDKNFSSAAPNNAGCTVVNYEYTLRQPAKIEASIAITENISCNSVNAARGNNTNGALKVSVRPGGGVPFVSGPNVPYEFLWEKKNGTRWESITNLNTDKSILKDIGAGEYRVRVRDANGIYYGATNTNRTGSIPLTQSLSEPTPISLNPTITHVNCNGDNNGQISLAISGGVLRPGDNYTVRWSDNGGTATTRNNLVADTYFVEVTDSNGCTTGSKAIEILEPNRALEVDYATNVKQPSAPNFTDGYIEARVKGGLQPTSANNYQFTWVNRSGTNLNTKVTQRYDASTREQVYQLNGISKGDYQLAIVDEDTSTGQLCRYTSSFETLSDPPALSLSIEKVRDISCNAANTSGNPFSDGVLKIVANGGNPPYRYEWKKKNNSGNWVVLPSQTGVEAVGLDNGEYAANIIDRNGIRAGTYINNVVTPIDATFNLQEPPLLEMSLNGQDVYCKSGNDAWLEATILGGVPPYDVEWSNGTRVLRTRQLTHRISNLVTNNYNVTITDARGCTISKNQQINEPTAALAIRVVDFKHPTFFNANNGFIKAEITGGTANADGSYNYNWKDAIGASVNTKVTSSIVSGIYTLLLEDIPFGKYKLDITDANYNSATSKGGCIISNDQELINPKPLQLQVKQTKEISCNQNNTTGGEYSDGELTAFPSGGVPFASGQAYIFTWKKKNTAGVWEVLSGNTTSKLSNISAGEYAANIEDANGIILGTYTNNVLVTPTDKIFILQEPVLLDIDTDVQDVFCKRGSDGKIEATLLGGTEKFDIKWYPTSNPRFIIKETIATSNRKTFIDNQFAGFYTLEVKDEKGCIITKDIEIKEPNNSLTISTLISRDPQYHNATNGQLKVAVSGGTANTDGSYRYQWLDKGGVMINQGSGVSVSGTYEITLDGLGSGRYTLEVEDANFNSATTTSGCTIQRSFDLQNPLPLTLRIEETNPISCHQNNIYGDESSDGVLKAIASGGVSFTTGGLPYIFTWSKKNPVSGIWEVLPSQTTATASGLDDGEYAINIEDANGVVLGTYVNNVLVTPTPIVHDLQEPNLLTLNINKQDVYCHGGSDGLVKATISGGIPPYTITWSTGKTETISVNTTEIVNLPKGDYTIAIVDDRGCQVDQLIPVNEPLNALNISTLLEKDPLYFNATNGQLKVSVSGGTPNADGSYRYQWLNKDGVMVNQGAGIATSGNYEVTLDGLGFGKYTLVVEDANFDSATTSKGCTIQQEFNLGNPLPLTLRIEETNPISCHQNNIYGDESSDGELKAIASGGVPFATGGLPYIFTWSKKNPVSGIWEVLPSQTTAIASDLDDGEYAVNIEDANGIVFGTYLNNALVVPTPVLYDLQEPDLLAISINKQDVYCNGGSDGFVKATISGGIPPYTITWSTGKTETISTHTTEIVDVPKGDYTVTIVDDRGCQVEQLVPVNAPIAPVEIAFTDYGRISTFGGSDGFIEATIKGGTPLADGAYYFRWENSIGTSLVSQVTASINARGEYVLLLEAVPADAFKLTITDAHYSKATTQEGCGVIEAEFVLYEPIVAEIEIEKPISCNGTNAYGNPYADAILKAKVKGGAPFTSSAPYTYIWKKRNAAGIFEILSNQTTITATDLGEGVYALNVEDRLGNVMGTYDGAVLINAEDATIAIEEPTLLEITSISKTKVSCVGNDGTATVAFTGGTAPYSIAWDNTDKDTTATADHLTPGVFTVHITDARGCEVEQQVEIPPIDNTQQEELEHIDITCLDYSDGRITIKMSDGIGPFTFGWRHAGTGLKTQSIPAGSYRSNITYENENQPFNTPQDGYSLTQLFDPATEQLQLTDLIPGVYEVIATDSRGCNYGATYRIIQPATPLNVKFVDHKQPSAPLFTDTFIEARVSGGNLLGNTSYRYQWKREEDNQDVTANTVETMDITTGEIVLRLEGVGEGTYRLEVNDYPVAPHVNPNGCFVEATFELVDPLPLVLKVAQTAIISCNHQNVFNDPYSNGELTATASGGVPFTTGLPYEYTWKRKDTNGVWVVLSSQTGPVASNLIYGEYAVNIKDANGIILGTYANNLLTEATDKFFTVEEPPLLEVSLSKRDVYCNDGDDAWVRAAITGGTPPYTVLWNTGKEVQNTTDLTHEISGLVKGNYEVIITDSLGCNVIQNIDVDQPEPLDYSYTDFDRPSVYGASDAFIEMTVSGGTKFADNTYRYRWVNSANQNLNAQVTTSFNSTGDYIIRLNNIPADTYRLTVEDSHFDPAIAKEGCTFIDSEFTLYEPLFAEISIHQEISCNAANEHLNPSSDGWLKADVKGGVPFTSGQAYDVVWKKKNPRTGVWEVLSDQQSFLASNIDAGEYAFNATDQRGTVIGRYRQDRLIDETDETFIFNEPDLLEVSISHTEVDCTIGNDASATATIVGGIPPYQIEWSTGATTSSISDLEPGKYFVVITDARGCIAENRITIESPKRLRLKLVAKNAPNCHNGVDGSIEVEAKGGVAPYSYEWNNGILGSRITGLPQGSYTVKVTDSNLSNGRCAYQETFELVNPELIPIDLGEDRTLCTGQVLDLDITIDDPRATYLWESPNGFRSAEAAVQLTDAGLYTATITNELGCEVSESIEIKYREQLIEAEFLVATTAQTNKEIAIVNVSSPRPEKIDWTLPKGVEVVTKDNDLVTLIFKEAGNYNLGLRAFQGDCYADYTKQVFVEEGQISAADFVEEGDFIKDVIVFPNPSNGVFKVKVALKREATVSMRLMSIINGDIMDTTVTTPKIEHLVDYNLNLSAGTYILIVETKFGNAIRKVIIK